MASHAPAPASQDTPVTTFITAEVERYCNACGYSARYHPYHRCQFCHPDCHRWHVPTWLVRLGQGLYSLWPF